MKNILSLFTQHKEIKMTPEEKKTAWEAISARAFSLTLDIPVRKPILSRLYFEELLPVLNRQTVFLRSKKYALGIITSTLIISGGVSAFAQGTLPGDFLYGVKTGINEKLQVAFAVTPQSKASVEAILATRRLEEVEGLALRGKLNSILELKINEAFNTHVRELDSHIAELESRSEFGEIAKVGVSFQTKIAVHAAVLKDIEVNSDFLSSTSTKINTIKNNPSMILSLEQKVLSATIPTIIATKNALIKTSVSTSTKVEVYNNKNNKNNLVLYIDPKEAREYLIKLHQEIGTPSPILEIPNPSVIPTFIP